MTFDIELMATQLNAPGPKGLIATLEMDNKDQVTFQPIITDSMKGTLTYKTMGETFDYTFVGKGLQSSTDYSLIYYADPYPGNGGGGGGALIGTMMTDASGDVIKSDNIELNKDLPSSPDSNPGAKIWLVPSTRYNSGASSIIGWNPTEYLFEMQFITYDDTGV